jgi:hypothetical protein
MLSTRDVLLSSDHIHRIWKLGLQDDSMSIEMIAAMNVADVAQDLLMRQGEFVFKITSILLRGVTMLYVKKTTVVLQTCEAIVERISLKFQVAEEKPATADHTIEIEEETIRLWRAEDNLESIVADERQEQPQLATYQPRSSQLAVQESPPRIDTRDDFGETPFVLTFETVPSLDAEVDDPISDSQPPPPPDFEPVVPFVPVAESVGKWALKIDPCPIIPMTQLSAMLEDASATLCHRPIVKRRLARGQFTSRDICVEFQKLFEEAKALGFKSRALESELQGAADEPVFDPLDQWSAPPEPPDLMPEHLDEQAALDAEPKERDATFELLPLISGHLDRRRSVRFLDVVTSQGRRELARMFFSSLSLHNRGEIRLRQGDWHHGILISQGSRYGQY